MYEAIKAGNYTLTESEYGLLLDLYTCVLLRGAHLLSRCESFLSNSS